MNVKENIASGNSYAFFSKFDILNIWVKSNIQMKVKPIFVKDSTKSDYLAILGTNIRLEAPEIVMIYSNVGELKYSAQL